MVFGSSVLSIHSCCEGSGRNQHNIQCLAHCKNEGSDRNQCNIRCLAHCKKNCVT